MTDGEGDSLNEPRRQEGVGDAAVGEPVFKEAAEGEEGFAEIIYRYQNSDNRLNY